MKDFLPYVMVNSSSEYFALSRGKREKYGLYRLPFALPWDDLATEDDGWNSFEKEIKKRYPIQAFFRYEVSSFFRYRIRRIKDIYYKIRNWVENPNKRIRKCIPRSEWVDRSWLVWEINKAIILDFHDEMMNGYVSWDHDDEVKAVKKFVIEAKEFIEKKIPELEHENDCVHKIWRKDNKDACYQKVIQIEKEIEDGKTKILNDLIKYRDYLWT